MPDQGILPIQDLRDAVTKSAIAIPPGFGHDGQGTQGTQGTRAILEVRAHDVPFMLEHGQRVCRLEFERTLAAPEILYGADAGSSYQGQGLRLSRHFRQ